MMKMLINAGNLPIMSHSLLAIASYCLHSGWCQCGTGNEFRGNFAPLLLTYWGEICGETGTISKRLGDWLRRDLVLTGTGIFRDPYAVTSETRKPHCVSVQAKTPDDYSETFSDRLSDFRLQVDTTIAP